MISFGLDNLFTLINNLTADFDLASILTAGSSGLGV